MSQTTLKEVRDFEQRQEEAMGLWWELRRVLALAKTNLGENHVLTVRLAVVTSCDPARVPDIDGMRAAWHELQEIPELLWQKLFSGWPSRGDELSDVRRRDVPTASALILGSAADTEVADYLVMDAMDRGNTCVRPMPITGSSPVALMVRYGTPRDVAIERAKKLVDEIEKFYEQHVRQD